MPLRPTVNSFWARLLLYLHLGLCALACCGYAEAPETFAQALERLHIKVTQTALIQALSDPRNEVRGIAAAQLAEMKLTDALPQIVRAAQDERDIRTQVNIAAAATWLGSDQGLLILKNICINPAVSLYVRIDAARHVFDEQDHFCFQSLVEVRSLSSEADERISALSLASQMRPKTEAEEKTVLRLALNALDDQDLRLRLQACDALRWIGDPTAIDPLRRAAEREREAAVREQMISVLNFLQGEHSGH